MTSLKYLQTVQNIVKKPLKLTFLILRTGSCPAVGSNGVDLFNLCKSAPTTEKFKLGLSIALSVPNLMGLYNRFNGRSHSTLENIVADNGFDRFLSGS